MPCGGQLNIFSGNMLSSINEITITGTTAAQVGQQYACAAAVNFQVNLPPAAGNNGEIIGIRVTNGSNGQITIKANGAELIDGVNARIIWANENAVLMSDGTGWTKITGKTIPMGAQMKLSTAQLDLLGNFSNNTLALDSVDWDNASLAFPVNNKFRTRRFGRYAISGYVQLDSASFGATLDRFMVYYQFDALTPNLITETDNIVAGEFPSPNIARSLRISGDVDLKIIIRLSNPANTTDIASAIVNLLELPEW